MTEKVAIPAKEDTRAKKPGELYVETYLAGKPAARPFDASWVAEAIDRGELIACPRCHFLHLPTLALPLEDGMEPRGACDVCAYVPDAATFGYHYECMADGLAQAPGWLEKERTGRAITLYDLWIGSTNGAQALLWAAMNAAVESVKATAASGQEGAA